MPTLQGRIAQADGSISPGRIEFGATSRPSCHWTPRRRISSFPDWSILQVNGSHGIDVMNASPDEILEVAGKLAHEGTTAWLPTAVTAPLDQIEKTHRAIADAMSRQSRGTSSGAKILGMHLEGPFISPKRLGAHPPLNLEPRGDAIHRVAALEKLRLITLAPELLGAREAIRLLASLGVVVSIGHTNATLEDAEAGIAAGARCSPICSTRCAR